MTDMTPQVVQDLISNFQLLKKQNTEKNKELSDIDKELSDFYHRLEGTVISHVSISHRMIKELKVILDKRRDIKFESMVLRMAYDNTHISMMKIIETHNNQKKQHQKVLQEIKQAGEKKHVLQEN